MKTVTNPPKKNWPTLCERPQMELSFLDSTVRNILNRVRKSGDSALKEFTLKFDKSKISVLKVDQSTLESAASQLDEKLKAAIQSAARNIQKFHQAQKRDTLIMDTMPGVTCWRKAVPIEKVGIYIPGGSAPLFSTVLMLGIPAKLAGCQEIVLCTPPDSKGNVHPAILYAAQLVGVTKVFRVGGAQAIAALAYGTESIPKVYKIFGPGNQYVTMAKQHVSQEGVAIDMPAGPSEVLVMADEKADPSFIAADLLSQAEHGADSQVMLVLNGNSSVKQIKAELDKQLAELPRKDIAVKSLEHSRMIVFKNDSDCIRFINEYAPEHLIINTRDPEAFADSIVNAGSVFLGAYSPESAGDYASGTNHTLPTNGYAKAYAGVSLESFMKYITFQKISEKGLQKLGPIVETMAVSENLHGHSNSIRVRLNKLKD